MATPWVTVLLAFAIVLITATGFRQLPAFRLGDKTLLQKSTISTVGFLVILWVSQLLIIMILGGIVAATIVNQTPMGENTSITELMDVAQKALTEISTQPWFIALSALLSAVGTLLAVVVAQYYLTKQPLRYLGLNRYPGLLWDIAMGLVLGVIGFVLLFGIAALTGNVTITVPTNIASNTLWAVLGIAGLFLLSAFAEELLSRGFLLQTIEQGWGTVAAAVLSSLLWSFLHYGNPGSNMAALANIAASGMVFAYFYVMTRSLWPAIALHFSWNLSEGILFGFPVSGLNVSIFAHAQLNGSDVITGGSFGPEAGMLIIPILVLQILILRWWQNVRPALGITHPEREANS